MYTNPMPYKDPEKRREFFRKRYEENKMFARSYKMKKGCKDCGYNSHHAALEFDHIPEKGGHLRGLVSRQIGKSLKVLKEEIARCEVVCSNCHSIRTFNRRKI